jgi:hypothetical protein
MSKITRSLSKRKNARRAVLRSGADAARSTNGCPGAQQVVDAEHDSKLLCLA